MTKTISINKPEHTSGDLTTNRPHKNLSELQEQLTELAVDLLLNGGDTVDVSLLLQALDRHNYRRFYRGLNPGASEEEIERDMKDFSERFDHLKAWYSELSKTWSNEKDCRKKRKRRAAGVQSAIEAARATIHNSLREHFEDFMSTSRKGFESAWFLNEVLDNMTCCGDDIGQAFARVMGADETYVQIPWEMEEEVRGFIGLLRNRQKAEPTSSDMAQRKIHVVRRGKLSHESDK